MYMDIPQLAQHLLPLLCHTVSPILPEHAFSINRALFYHSGIYYVRAIQTVMNSDLVLSCIFFPHGCVN